MAPDSLTCGVCRKEFPLAEIVRFIQHKVLSCNKENYRLTGAGARPSRGGEGDSMHSLQVDGAGSSSSGSSGANAAGSVCSRRPSISAPINSRRMTPTLTTATSSGGGIETLLDDEMTTTDGATAVKAETTDAARERPMTADAESNTVNSGKSKLEKQLHTVTTLLELYRELIFIVKNVLYEPMLRSCQNKNKKTKQKGIRVIYRTDTRLTEQLNIICNSNRIRNGHAVTRYHETNRRARRGEAKFRICQGKSEKGVGP